jgi:hypothetical protein
MLRRRNAMFQTHSLPGVTLNAAAKIRLIIISLPALLTVDYYQNRWFDRHRNISMCGMGFRSRSNKNNADQEETS